MRGRGKGHTYGNCLRGRLEKGNIPECGVAPSAPAVKKCRRPCGSLGCCRPQEAPVTRGILAGKAIERVEWRDTAVLSPEPVYVLYLLSSSLRPHALCIPPHLPSPPPPCRCAGAYLRSVSHVLPPKVRSVSPALHSPPLRSQTAEGLLLDRLRQLRLASPLAAASRREAPQMHLAVVTAPPLPHPPLPSLPLYSRPPSSAATVSSPRSHPRNFQQAPSEVRQPEEGTITAERRSLPLHPP